MLHLTGVIKNTPQPRRAAGHRTATPLKALIF